MKIYQATAGRFENNIYDLPNIFPQEPLHQKKEKFKALFSYTKDDYGINAYLLQEDRNSEFFSRSNKAIRKLENMIDVINCSLFDFELIHEQFKECNLSHFLQDIISILKCTKTTLSQAVLKGTIEFTLHLRIQ